MEEKGLFPGVHTRGTASGRAGPTVVILKQHKTNVEASRPIWYKYGSNSHVCTVDSSLRPTNKCDRPTK